MRIPNTRIPFYINTPSTSSKKAKDENYESSATTSTADQDLQSESPLEIDNYTFMMDFASTLLKRFMTIKLTDVSVSVLSGTAASYLPFIPKPVIAKAFIFIMNTCKFGLTESIKIEMIMDFIKTSISQAINDNQLFADQIKHFQQIINSMTDWMGDEQDAITYPVFVLLFSLALSQQMDPKKEGYFSSQINKVIDQCLSLINFIQGLKIENYPIHYQDNAELMPQKALEIDIVGSSTNNGFSEIETNSTLTIEKCQKATVENKPIDQLTLHSSTGQNLTPIDFSPTIRLLQKIKNDYGIHSLHDCDAEISLTNEVVNGESKQHYYQHIGCNAVKNGEQVSDAATLKLSSGKTGLDHPDYFIPPLPTQMDTASASCATSTSIVTNLLMVIGACALVSAENYKYDYSPVLTNSQDNDSKSFYIPLIVLSSTVMGIIMYLQYYLSQNNRRGSRNTGDHPESVDTAVLPTSYNMSSNSYRTTTSSAVTIHDPLNNLTNKDNIITNPDTPVPATLATTSQEIRLSTTENFIDNPEETSTSHNMTMVDQPQSEATTLSIINSLSTVPAEQQIDCLQVMEYQDDEGSALRPVSDIYDEHIKEKQNIKIYSESIKQLNYIYFLQSYLQQALKKSGIPENERPSLTCPIYIGGSFKDRTNKFSKTTSKKTNLFNIFTRNETPNRFINYRDTYALDPKFTAYNTMALNSILSQFYKGTDLKVLYDKNLRRFLTPGIEQKTLLDETKLSLRLLSHQAIEELSSKIKATKNEKEIKDMQELIVAANDFLLGYDTIYLGDSCLNNSQQGYQSYSCTFQGRNIDQFAFYITSGDNPAILGLSLLTNQIFFMPSKELVNVKMSSLRGINNNNDYHKAIFLTNESDRSRELIDYCLFKQSKKDIFNLPVFRNQSALPNSINSKSRLIYFYKPEKGEVIKSLAMNQLKRAQIMSNHDFYSISEQEDRIFYPELAMLFSVALLPVAPLLGVFAAPSIVMTAWIATEFVCSNIDSIKVLIDNKNEEETNQAKKALTIGIVATYVLPPAVTKIAIPAASAGIRNIYKFIGRGGGKINNIPNLFRLPSSSVIKELDNHQLTEQLLKLNTKLTPGNTALNHVTEFAANNGMTTQKVLICRYAGMLNHPQVEEHFLVEKGGKSFLFESTTENKANIKPIESLIEKERESNELVIMIKRPTDYNSDIEVKEIQEGFFHTINDEAIIINAPASFKSQFSESYGLSFNTKTTAISMDDFLSHENILKIYPETAKENLDLFRTMALDYQAKGLLTSPVPIGDFINDFYIGNNLIKVEFRNSFPLNLDKLLNSGTEFLDENITNLIEKSSIRVIKETIDLYQQTVGRILFLIKEDKIANMLISVGGGRYLINSSKFFNASKMIEREILLGDSLGIFNQGKLVINAENQFEVISGYPIGYHRTSLLRSVALDDLLMELQQKKINPALKFITTNTDFASSKLITDIQEISHIPLRSYMSIEDFMPESSKIVIGSHDTFNSLFNRAGSNDHIITIKDLTNSRKSYYMKKASNQWINMVDHSSLSDTKIMEFIKNSKTSIYYNPMSNYNLGTIFRSYKTKFALDILERTEFITPQQKQAILFNNREMGLPSIRNNVIINNQIHDVMSSSINKEFFEEYPFLVKKNNDKIESIYIAIEKENNGIEFMDITEENSHIDQFKTLPQIQAASPENSEFYTARPDFYTPRFTSLLGPDSKIEFDSHLSVLSLKLHGAAFSSAHNNALELSTLISGWLAHRRIPLSRVNRIHLFSCYSGFGSKVSQGSLLSDLLNKPVKAYSGKISKQLAMVENHASIIFNPTPNLTPRSLKIKILVNNKLNDMTTASLHHMSHFRMIANSVNTKFSRLLNAGTSHLHPRHTRDITLVHPLPSTDDFLIEINKKNLLTFVIHNLANALFLQQKSYLIKDLVDFISHHFPGSSITSRDIQNRITAIRDQRNDITIQYPSFSAEDVQEYMMISLMPLLMNINLLDDQNINLSTNNNINHRSSVRVGKGRIIEIDDADIIPELPLARNQGDGYLDKILDNLKIDNFIMLIQNNARFSAMFPDDFTAEEILMMLYKVTFSDQHISATLTRMKEVDLIQMAKLPLFSRFMTTLLSETILNHPQQLVMNSSNSTSSSPRLKQALKINNSLYNNSLITPPLSLPSCINFLKRMNKYRLDKKSNLKIAKVSA